LAALAPARQDWPQAEDLAGESLTMAELVGRQESIAADRRRVVAHFIPPDFPGIIRAGYAELAHRGYHLSDGPKAATGQKRTKHLGTQPEQPLG
jgi:hypothetical protein